MYMKHFVFIVSVHSFCFVVEIIFSSCIIMCASVLHSKAGVDKLGWGPSCNPL